MDKRTEEAIENIRGKRELKLHKECTEWILRVREDLSDVGLSQDVLGMAVVSPKGIYEMVMELKQMLKETETNLMAAYASAIAQQDRRKKAEDKQIELEKDIEELHKQNKLLTELCLSQYKTLRFVNKVMFDTTKHQRSLPENEVNPELLYLASSTNDIIADHPNEHKILEALKKEHGIDFKTK